MYGTNPFAHNYIKEEADAVVPNMQNGRQKGWYLVIRVSGAQQFISHEQFGGPYPTQRDARNAKRSGMQKDPDLQHYNTKAWDGERWTNRLAEDTDGHETMIEEERTLNDNAASLIELATNVCLGVWYDLTKQFHSKSDKYDPEMVNPSDKFMHFKLAPGGDARQEAYKKIIDATENIAEKLNEVLGRGGLFVPEIVLKDGMLETRVRYAEGKGGIFQCKTKDQDVGVGIILTMPRQDVIRNAFKSLVTTPEFPVGDDIPEPERVVADPPSDPSSEGGEAAPQSDKPGLGDLGGVNVVGKGQPDLDDIAPLNMSHEEKGDVIEEGKRPAEGFEPPPERGFWVVFGPHRMTGDAEYHWKGAWKQYGIELPGKAFPSKDEAVEAKDELLQRARSGVIDFQARNQFHVKQWDGREYHAVNLPMGPRFHKYDDPEQVSEPEDEAPLDSYEADNDDVPADWVNRAADFQRQPRRPHPQFQQRPHNEEVAANAVGGANGGAWKSNNPTNASDPYDATRHAAGANLKRSLTRRKTNERAEATRRWEEAAEKPFSLSGGPFG